MDGTSSGVVVQLTICSDSVMLVKLSQVELEESAAKLPSLQTALDNAYKYVSFTRLIQWSRDPKFFLVRKGVDLN